MKRSLLLFLIDLCIVWTINIKFNAIYFMACICFAMWVFIVIQDKKKKDFTESKIVFGFFAGGVAAAFLLGWSPYITNIYRYQEFLPGIFGDSAKATGSFTASTAGMNPIQIFWITIFSKMGDYWDVPDLPLKIPFSVSQEEWNHYSIYVPQFGTFGMFFSGLFLIAMLLLLFIVIKNRKKFQENRLKISFVLWVVIFLHCMICPVGLGGLRYVAHFYIVFAYALILGFYFFNQKKCRFCCISCVSWL